jgi:hypothetical protein
MVKTLNAQQDNFKIIEDGENVDHLQRYILKLYDENFLLSHYIFQHHRMIVHYLPLFYTKFIAVRRTNLRQVFEKHNFLGKAIRKCYTVSNHRSVEAKKCMHIH